MITVTERSLQQLGFDPTSPLQAVQHVRNCTTKADADSLVFLDGAGGSALGLVNRLLGTETSFEDFTMEFHRDNRLLNDYCLMVAQGVAEAVVKNVGKPIDEAEVLAGAKARVARLMSAPQHGWMFVKTTAQSTVETTAVAVSKEVDVKVEVKADGKIKKGGKETLAIALYKKYTDGLNGQPYDNQTFIKTLMKELGMSKAGATTYNYNMKKKFGGQIESKKKS